MQPEEPVFAELLDRVRVHRRLVPLDRSGKRLERERDAMLNMAVMSAAERNEVLCDVIAEAVPWDDVVKIGFAPWPLFQSDVAAEQAWAEAFVA